MPNQSLPFQQTLPFYGPQCRRQLDTSSLGEATNQTKPDESRRRYGSLCLKRTSPVAYLCTMANRGNRPKPDPLSIWKTSANGRKRCLAAFFSTCPVS